ncbi:hypothetical protein ESCO_004158 [Escovopsis weberi]|uniref:Uncharacterized protein n=1 Tax=Escovopsis weberi TaxID=150374 RepID=A0A0M8MWW7_ESCWE|nr:hypothetical protein ESCO_004158 [Escovopsis weberi]
MSIFVPILGGGFLIALTGPDGTVRMYPNKAVFGVLLALLAVYVGGLCLAVPFRSQLALPRPVTCIADMVSLCSASELVLDAAFRSRADGTLDLWWGAASTD